mgnify:CR=1 FL=1|jgi:hypothetical protein
MTELSNPTNCEQFPLCEHLQKYFADDSAALLMAAIQIECERRCCECPHYEANNESPT